jgi:hypothetical protein
MRARFGLLNQLHQHALPQVDRPNVLVRFFGEEQLVEKGAELSWVAPLPIYLEGVIGIFNGDNEEAFGRGSLRKPLVTGRLRTFFELGATGAIQLGVSGATGETEEEHRASYVGFDAKYKYVPAGWSHPLVTLGGEFLYGRRRVSEGDNGEEPSAVEENGSEGEITEEQQTTSSVRTVRPRGWYAWAEVQPWKQWVFGMRYDSTDFPDKSGDEWAIGPYVAYMPSEFLRFRLGYKHTDRSGVEAGPRTMNEILLQATFILGAHPAHPF